MFMVLLLNLGCQDLHGCRGLPAVLAERFGSDM
jgi:hypothetical protein